MPRLILKKTSRRTQAVVVSEGIFCAARCVIFYLQSMKPTLVGTKNLYENGPNPFFFIRDPKFGQAGNEKLIRKWTKSVFFIRDRKFGQSQTYGNGFVSAWFRHVWVRSDFSLN